MNMIRLTAISTPAFQPRRRDACFLARARAAVGGKRLLGCALLIKGYFSGFSMDSTARSISRSGQYKWCGLGSCTFAISRTDASRNQGNSFNARNNSRSPMNNQKPCGETLVTSTGEVLGPGAADFIEVLLD